MARKLLFLINRMSGTRSKEGLINFIRERTTAAAIDFDFCFLTPGMTAVEIRKAAEAANVTDLIVCGGDGTVNSVAHALQHSSINIGIIPIGSGNGLARSAGIPLKPGAALKVIYNGTVKQTDAFLVNNAFSCMLSGIGLDAAVATSFANSGSRGLITYAKESVRQFFRASPLPFQILVNNQSISLSAYFISIANSNQFGNNFTIAPKASLHDGLLDIVIVKKMWKLKMLYAIAKQLQAGYPVHADTDDIESGDILYLQTPSLTIHNPNMAPFHIDGDPATTSDKFEINILPAAFNLIGP